VRERFDALVLMGPPGSGKSFLGRHLAATRVAAYVEMEPLLAERFGRGEAFAARIAEAGAFLWSSYVDQLATSKLPVAFESTGVSDRALLDALHRSYRVAFVRVETPRFVCAERVVTRGTRRNIASTDDAERVGRFYDLWCERVAPTLRFDAIVDGADVAAAAQVIREMLERKENQR
jgi:shikimate kinase